MEYLELVKKRRSIRKYKPDPVSDHDLKLVLEAARLAPSWRNIQCCRYIVVKDRTTKEKLAGEGRKWISAAPLLVVVCADPKESGHRPEMDMYLVDIGIAFEHLILAAIDIGLGACWIGAFDEKKVKEALGVPDEIRVVAFTPLGYPDEKKDNVFARKHLRDICFYEKYKQIESPSIQKTIISAVEKVYFKSRRLSEKVRNLLCSG